MYRPTSLLQPKSQSVRMKKESFFRVNIREINRVLATKCLSYIYLANSLCYTNLAYSKRIYVLNTINM